MTRRAKIVQGLVALALIACTPSPFVEMLLHSNNSIFASGHDMETSLALVLLLIELSVAVARLFVVVLPAFFERFGIFSFQRLTRRSDIVARVLPTISPPVPLRI